MLDRVTSLDSDAFNSQAQTASSDHSKAFFLLLMTLTRELNPNAGWVTKDDEFS